MPAAPPGAEPNDRATVLLVRDGAFDLLLTADAESNVVAGLDLPVVEAIKVPHHGSEDLGLPALLARLRPRAAVIEVGRRNGYGHPDAVDARGAPARGADRAPHRPRRHGEDHGPRRSHAGQEEG